jgi:hypothetical protein
MEDFRELNAILSYIIYILYGTAKWLAITNLQVEWDQFSMVKNHRVS